VFRTFGELAELPLLAVRPELQQRNGLGRLLLAAVERLLLTAGAKVGAHRPGLLLALLLPSPVMLPCCLPLLQRSRHALLWLWLPLF
jgi:hypothetical protein